MIRIGSIVLRVDDLQRQTEFWEAALGCVRRDSGESDDFVLLARPTAPGRTFRSTRFVRRSKFLPPPPRPVYGRPGGRGRTLARPRCDRGALGQTATGRGLRHPRRSRGQPLLRRRHLVVDQVVEQPLGLGLRRQIARFQRKNLRLKYTGSAAQVGVVAAEPVLAHHDRHFSRTRRDATLSGATRAWSGRERSTAKNAVSPSVAIPLPQ